jgi:hypothetical protein
VGVSNKSAFSIIVKYGGIVDNLTMIFLFIILTSFVSKVTVTI